MSLIWRGNNQIVQWARTLDTETAAREVYYVQLNLSLDALALGEDGAIEVVIDWKSDVDPSTSQVEHYRAQVRDYLAATGAKKGLLVFATNGRTEFSRQLAFADDDPGPRVIETETE